MVMMRISSPVWQAFGHLPPPENCASEHEMHQVVRRNKQIVESRIGGKRLHSLPFLDSCCNIAITLIDPDHAIVTV
jgi:hypothetical protein